MAITTTRINGTAGQAGYEYYLLVKVNDTIVLNTFEVSIEAYLVNHGSRTNTNGWTKHTEVNGYGEITNTNQNVDTTGADRYGGETLVINHSQAYHPVVGTQQIYVSSYISKSGYASYDPGYCSASGYVQMPKVASTWSKSILSIPDVTQSFTLPINKYVSDYYNVAEVRNQDNSLLIKTINDAVNGTSVTFTSSELNTITTIDTNKYQQNQRFYIDLKTYTNSSKTTQIGSTQRLICDSYLPTPQPTATYTVVEQDANVISLLGSSTSSKIIKESSDLLFTITPTTKYSAVVDNVKVNGAIAAYDSGNQVYVLNATNITTDTFNIVVTDSRNYSTTYEVSKTLLDYLAIKINSGWTAVRANQTSSDIVLNATIDCYSNTIDGQTNTPTIQYSTDGSNWTNITSGYTHTSNKITITNLTISNLISYQTPGKFYLKITDLLSTGQDNKDIPVGIYTFALGDRKARFNGTIELADSTGNNRVNVGDGIIVDKGTGYIKYGNGIMICYGKADKTALGFNSWGNIYISSSVTGEVFAQQFTTLYSVQMSIEGTNSCWLINSGQVSSTTATQSYQVARADSVLSAAFTINYIAIGTWK